MKNVFVYVVPLIGIVRFSNTSLANVVGSDIQNFNPITSGIDFVTVQSSETLDPGVVNFGLFLNYAINTLPNYERVSDQKRTKFDDTLLGADVNVGIGLKKNWDIGFSVPQVLDQDSEDDNGIFQGRVSETGVSEYRINTKYRFKGDQDGGFAAVATVNFDQVENNPFAGDDPGPTYNLELVWDTTHNEIAYGVNAGYRWRDPGAQLAGIPIEPFDDQFIASFAARKRLNKWDMNLIGEVFGSFPVEKPDSTTDRDVSSVEVLLGVKKDLKHNLAVHAGGGTELYHGSSSPDWRIYTGLNWNFGPLWHERSDDEQVIEPQNSEYFVSRVIKQKEKFIAGDVLFAFDSAELSPGFKEILGRLAQYLNREKGFKTLIVEGHTDSVGPEAYNQNLSQRRAESVVRHLVDVEKISPDKISGAGFGESRPVADNSNYQGRAKNRRVEFNITR